MPYCAQPSYYNVSEIVRRQPSRCFLRSLDIVPEIPKICLQDWLPGWPFSSFGAFLEQCSDAHSVQGGPIEGCQQKGQVWLTTHCLNGIRAWSGFKRRNCQPANGVYLGLTSPFNWSEFSTSWWWHIAWKTLIYRPVEFMNIWFGAPREFGFSCQCWQNHGNFLSSVPNKVNATPYLACMARHCAMSCVVRIGFQSLCQAWLRQSTNLVQIIGKQYGI